MTLLLLSIALAIPGADPVANTPLEGVLPLGADNKPLNFDFETGTLKDWTTEGDAFEGQPIEGDTVAKRRADMRSGHQGKFWIGGYEKHLDKRKGKLLSVPFTVTHPWASFMIAGGPTKDTYVELVDVDAKISIFKVSGDESELLKRTAVDLSKHLGKKIQIQIVDNSAGPWGHINFDDFRFHSDKPKVPERIAPVALAADGYKYAGQKPEDAAKNMIVPKGFNVSLFAGEPDLHQPIAFCFDDRGRLWVVEAYVYPKRHPAKGPMLPEAECKNGDKILIFEDTDGDGKFDKKTLFLEGLNLVSGIEYGFGGIWVGAAPYFLFIPILEGDKAGEPKILLDGFGYQDTHETLNSFIWGPDGWLYGCHGVFTHSAVGKPGTKDEDRTKINAGVWRYHPTKHTFEVFAHGTSNPWGLDYNQYGDFFVEACVIPHLWHIVQGGRYARQAGQHFNPYTYDDIKTIAKHRHYVGATAHAGNGKSDSAGGGHAHSGLICYQGGTWPKEYHGKLFMGNLHGHRINVDVVTPKGSSYEGDRNPDFLLSNDKHCVIVAIHTGPDGNVFFCDWSDKQVCHLTNPEVWDRTNGRLFKISYEGTKPVKNLDLQKLSDEDLVKLQASDNEWMVRHSRRILQERSWLRLKLESGTPESMANLRMRGMLAKIVLENTDEKMRLNALWTLSTFTPLGHNRPIVQSLSDTSPFVRACGVHIYGEMNNSQWVRHGRGFDYTTQLVRLAEKDPSPVVRRALTSAIMRHDVPAKWIILEKMIAHDEDATDHVLPHLYWYALEPLCTSDPARALQIAANGKIPQLLTFATRRVGAISTPEAEASLITGLVAAKSPEHQLAYLGGLQESVKGKRTTEAPKGWAEVYPVLLKSENKAVRDAAASLAVKFGDKNAIAALRKDLADALQPAAARQLAMNALVDARDKDCVPILQKLLADQALQNSAVLALASFDDPKTAAAIIAVYPSLNAAGKQNAISTLASRSAYAKELLAAVEAKVIPSTDIPAEIVRQLRNLEDKSISAKLAVVWGTVRDTPEDRKKLITDWSNKLTKKAITDADLGQGRAIYSKVCAQCHTLYGTGGKVGPEITGANRSNIAYLLENVFDPSALIPKEYAATKIDMVDGRIVTGIIKEENAQTLTVVTATETLQLRIADIDKRTPSALSMMPDDLTKNLTEKQVIALFAYLQHPQQVSLLADAENAKDFFNGKDLSNFEGDMEVWKVENGEIVGLTATGLKKNTFLKSTMEAADFRLSVKVKLTPNAANSGIQFRSVPIEGGEMRGPQADIGKGWWGKLYEESGRGLLVKEGGEKFVKENEWNEYIVEADGPKVKIWINGNLVCDYEDDKLAKRGRIAFQVHSGGPTDVRYKDIKLEVLTK